jgi:hypothetical protein
MAAVFERCSSLDELLQQRKKLRVDVSNYAFLSKFVDEYDISDDPQAVEFREVSERIIECLGEPIEDYCNSLLAINA